MVMACDVIMWNMKKNDLTVTTLKHDILTPFTLVPSGNPLPVTMTFHGFRIFIVLLLGAPMTLRSCFLLHYPVSLLPVMNESGSRRGSVIFLPSCESVVNYTLPFQRMPFFTHKQLSTSPVFHFADRLFNRGDHTRPSAEELLHLTKKI
jgi:hypothetical protein